MARMSESNSGECAEPSAFGSRRRSVAKSHQAEAEPPAKKHYCKRKRRAVGQHHVLLGREALEVLGQCLWPVPGFVDSRLS
jgi:hypothetical protein